MATIQINIKFLSGRLIQLHVKPSDTVEFVKDEIGSEEGFSTAQLTLVYGGKELKDMHTLSHYFVRNEATIHITVSPGSLKPSLRNVPGENPFPTYEEAEQILDKWHRMADKGGFDADTHIVAPEAHYSFLEGLEKRIVERSELFAQQGFYKMDKVSAEIEEKAKIRITRPNGNGPVASEKTRLLRSLCESVLIIENVVTSLGLMKDGRFRSLGKSYFSILLLQKSARTAQIVTISMLSLLDIRSILNAALRAASRGTVDELKNMIKSAVEKFHGILGQKLRVVDALDACRAMAYMLDLGLVAYAGSHASQIGRGFLKSDITSFSPNSRGSVGFECSLWPLACLNGFLDAKHVWVFDLHEPKARQRRTKKKLSILTTIDAFSDIWGPVWAEMEADDSLSVNRVVKFNHARGCIRRVPSRGVSSSPPGIVECHWYSWTQEQRRRLSTIFSSKTQLLTMSVNDTLLIGTDMTEKPTCTFSLQEYESSYGGRIRVAGPKPSTWRFDGVAVSLQLAAPKVVMLQIEGQTKRVPETTVKEHAWQKWHSNPARANPGILNNYFGVEVSACTGNARRVPLKQMLLMSPIQELLERQMPHWKRQPWGIEFIKALASQNENAIFNFWGNYVGARPFVGRLVASVLDVLNETGYNGSCLQTAFMHDNQEGIINIGGRENGWASLLKDSYLTATYALINNSCLEYRSPDHSTSVCNNEQRFTVFQTALGKDEGSGSEEKLEKYLRIKPQGLLFKKLDADDSNASQPCVLIPESSFGLAMRLVQRLTKAKEMVRQFPNNLKIHHKVILRSSRPSFGGMPFPRQRATLAEAPAENTIDLTVAVDLAAKEDVLSQLESEWRIIQDLYERGSRGPDMRRRG